MYLYEQMLDYKGGCFRGSKSDAVLVIAQLEEAATCARTLGRIP